MVQSELPDLQYALHLIRSNPIQPKQCYLKDSKMFTANTGFVNQKQIAERLRNQSDASNRLTNQVLESLQDLNHPICHRTDVCSVV